MYPFCRILAPVTDYWGGDDYKNVYIVQIHLIGLITQTKLFSKTSLYFAFL